MTKIKTEIVLGADHAGFELKEALKEHLTKKGMAVHDLSPEFVAGDDYPIVAKNTAKEVVATNQPAILICGSGHGMATAANRLRGARAAVIRSVAEAKYSRQHGHANILALGGSFTSAALAKKILDTWLATPYSKEARHVRRVKELDQ